VRRDRVIVAVVLAALAATACAGVAAAARKPVTGPRAHRAGPRLRPYPWPVFPFRKPHPVRGNFGDPRTIFLDPFDPARPAEKGAVSFHNGVDISAPVGAPVYPVLSGVVRRTVGGRIIVRVPGGRVFEYEHVDPAVAVGATVAARKTILGYVQAWAKHAHFTEHLPTGPVVNPLLPGHLTPYADTTRPTVAGIGFRAPDGTALDPYRLAGPVTIVADAYDVPSIAPPAPWDNATVSPARVSWSLRTETGQLVVRPSRVVDFRTGLPARRDFWRVYAQGTYQNHPRFADRQYGKLAGKYLFRLTQAPFATDHLPDGVYTLTVSAGDIRRNTAKLAQVVGICNLDPTPCDQLVAKRGGAPAGS
jgi:hypothetical protein